MYTYNIVLVDTWRFKHIDTYAHTHDKTPYVYHRNQAETAELLVGAKAAVDYKNNLGLFPLILATALGHYAVMKVLTKTTVECLNTQVICIHCMSLEFC